MGGARAVAGADMAVAAREGVGKERNCSRRAAWYSEPIARLLTVRAIDCVDSSNIEEFDAWSSSQTSCIECAPRDELRQRMRTASRSPTSRPNGRTIVERTFMKMIRHRGSTAARSSAEFCSCFASREHSDGPHRRANRPQTTARSDCYFRPEVSAPRHVDAMCRFPLTIPVGHTIQQIAVVHETDSRLGHRIHLRVTCDTT